MTLEDFLSEWNNTLPTLEVHTSGSTGTPKRMLVEKSRMRASAQMTCDFLGIETGGNALLCMPLDFIAGKMMVVRALERNLHLIEVEPSGHPLAHLSDDVLSIDLAAMVPLQVFNSLQVPLERERLLRIKHLIIGGGAIPDTLEAELRQLPINIWSSYGMTETLSHIALRPIAEDYYSPLPGITLEQDANDCLIIHAPALCTDTLVTNDIVRFIGENKFQIIGRRDNTVCSGGIKIQIEEVEHWLHSLGINNVVVTYRSDARLGQALVYLCTDSLDIDSLIPPTHIPTARYWLPRHVVHVPQLPLTANGKPDRALAHKIAENHL